jgi:hypothetical protein
MSASEPKPGERVKECMHPGIYRPLFGSLSGLQPTLHPDRGDISLDFAARSMLFVTKP